MFGPAVHAGLEEGAIDDQLPPAVEQVEQARLALGTVELVLLLHGQPRHPPTLGGQRVTGPGQLLLLHEQLLARSLPLPQRHYFRCFHRIDFRHNVPLNFIAFLLLASLAVTLVVAAAPLFILIPIDLSLANQSLIQLARLEAAGATLSPTFARVTASPTATTSPAPSDSITTSCFTGSG